MQIYEISIVCLFLSQDVVLALYVKHFSPCLYIFPSISPKIGPLKVKQFLSLHTLRNNVANPKPINIDIIIFPKDEFKRRLKFIIYSISIFRHTIFLLDKMSEPEKTLDVRGLYCPSPAMQTVVELSKMQVGQVLLVLADDPAAEDDITDLCRTRGHELVQLNKNGSDLEFTIKKIK